MDRREVLKNVALLLGGAVSATTLSIIEQGCNRVSERNGNKPLFGQDRQKLIEEIADTIIPATDTPGAKAAGVGPFIVMMIEECYPPDIQTDFVKGLDEVDNRSESRFNKSFVAASPAERAQVLQEIAAETKEKRDNDRKAGRKRKKTEPYFFQLAKELTLLGYFTSEIGATQALAYVAVPGRYEGSVPMKEGQKAWAI